MYNTNGGPKHNSISQVIDNFGRPIKRLYAVGELGSLWGMLYQSGGNLAECFTSARIAARNLIKEKRIKGS